MKALASIITGMTVLVFAVAGCNKQASVDTSAIEKSFQPADSAIKSNADKAVSAIKARDYSGALAELQKLGSQAKLTPDQQQAVKDAVVQVQKMLAEAANKVAGEAGKAAGDLQKSLPK
jgi:uncharacterized lipoprotein NlpE involved in copper resistance